MQKILVIATVALSLATAALGFLNKTKLSESQAEATKFKTESVANATKAEKTATDLKAATEKLAIANTDTEKNVAEMTSLKEQASKTAVALTNVQKQNTDKDAIITQQKTDLATKDARITELESKTTAVAKPATSETDDLKKQLEEKDILNTSLQSKLKDQESQLSALKEREADRRKKQMRNGLEGRILAVNSSWNFVVLSLGDRNGVVNNAEMLIKRGAQLIGKLRITSVEPSTSIADIVANSVRPGFSVQPGDNVIYMGPGDEPEPKTP
jgi:predicted RNase H-like nuclease (RuvC/YqgF family)